MSSASVPSEQLLHIAPSRTHESERPAKLVGKAAFRPARELRFQEDEEAEACQFGCEDDTDLLSRAAAGGQMPESSEVEIAKLLCSEFSADRSHGLLLAAISAFPDLGPATAYAEEPWDEPPDVLRCFDEGLNSSDRRDDSSVRVRAIVELPTAESEVVLACAAPRQHGFGGVIYFAVVSGVTTSVTAVRVLPSSEANNHSYLRECSTPMATLAGLIAYVEVSVPLVFDRAQGPPTVMDVVAATHQGVALSLASPRGAVTGAAVEHVPLGCRSGRRPHLHWRGTTLKSTTFDDACDHAQACIWSASCRGARSASPWAARHGGATAAGGTSPVCFRICSVARTPEPMPLQPKLSFIAPRVLPSTWQLALFGRSFAYTSEGAGADAALALAASAADVSAALGACTGWCLGVSAGLDGGGSAAGGSERRVEWDEHSFISIGSLISKPVSSRMTSFALTGSSGDVNDACGDARSYSTHSSRRSYHGSSGSMDHSGGSRALDCVEAAVSLASTAAKEEAPTLPLPARCHMEAMACASTGILSVSELASNDDSLSRVICTPAASQYFTVAARVDDWVEATKLPHPSQLCEEASGLPVSFTASGRRRLVAKKAWASGDGELGVSNQSCAEGVASPMSAPPTLLPRRTAPGGCLAAFSNKAMRLTWPVAEHRHGRRMGRCATWMTPGALGPA